MIPGFVDLQVNGYKGIDFSSLELTREDFISAARALLSDGTCAFLPTLITSPQTVYEQNLKMISEILEMDEFRGRLPGIHLEGPFLSPADGARGAHNPDWMLKPDIGYLKKLNDWARGKVKLLTIAADLDGAVELAAYAAAQGIAVSLGHHLALSDDLERLHQAGAVALTHMGNAMPAQMSKKDNPLWAALANDGLIGMIITDGHHLSSDLIKIFVRTKGVSGTIVVSDASPPAGMPPGQYTTLGNKVVLDENGRLYNPEKGCLVGSSATMMQCMNHLASLGLMSGQDLLEVGFYNPLKLIGVDPETITSNYNIQYDEDHKIFCMVGQGSR